MYKSEKGFSTPLAMAVIFSLSMLILVYSMLISTTERKIGSYKLDVESREHIDVVISKIVEEMQRLKNENNDFEYSPIIKNIEDIFIDVNLHIVDVSTAINVKFINSEILESESFSRYLHRNDCCLTEFGWINSKIADKNFIDEINKDFNSLNVFPLVNTMPLYNFHIMDEQFLITIFQYCKINESEEVIKKISSLNETKYNKQDIAKILGISENHQVFDFIGFKTTFWSCTFTKDNYNVRLIIAAVPDKVKTDCINEYVLIEKNISRIGEKSC